MGISSTSGYASPDTVSGVTITFLIVAAVAVALRLWTRFHIAQNAGLDDVVGVAGAIEPSLRCVGMLMNAYSSSVAHCSVPLPSRYALALKSASP